MDCYIPEFGINENDLTVPYVIVISQAMMYQVINNDKSLGVRELLGLKEKEFKVLAAPFGPVSENCMFRGEEIHLTARFPFGVLVKGTDSILIPEALEIKDCASDQ